MKRSFHLNRASHDRNRESAIIFAILGCFIYGRIPPESR